MLQIFDFGAIQFFTREMSQKGGLWKFQLK